MGPYVYYSSKVQFYGQKHKPEGYYFPSYFDMWPALVSMVFHHALRRIIEACRPILMKLVITHDEHGDPVKDEDRLERCRKNENHIYNIIFYSISTLWGWLIIKDSEALPWYLLGKGEFKLSV